LCKAACGTGRVTSTARDSCDDHITITTNSDLDTITGAGNSNANPTTNDARSYSTTHTNPCADCYVHPITNTYRAIYRPSF
jgi:hypothetical protein